MIGMNDVALFAACGNYLSYLLYISLITRGGFFPMHGETIAVYEESPAHGARSSAASSTKCRKSCSSVLQHRRAFFVSYKTAASGRAIAYLYHQKTAIPLSILFIFFLFFHTGSHPRRLKWVAFILQKRKRRKTFFRLRLVRRYFPLRLC